jgi:acetophenone carboxylase
MLDYGEIKTDLLRWLHPTQATEIEQQMAAELDHGEFEIYSHKLDAALDEAHEVFVRTGISAMLKSGDVVVGIHNEHGDLVTASCGTYLHGPIAQLPVKFLIKRYVDGDEMDIEPGDIFYCNEALVGGLHNPDQMAIMPVFNDGELIAWCSAALHQAETGAIEPGGMPLSAESRYDEGMRLTPIKIGEDHEIRPDLMDMMTNFISRSPRMQEVDVRARCTAVDKLCERVKEIADDTGNSFVRGLFRRLIQNAEQSSRSRISSWRDGEYTAVGFFDTIGHTEALMKVTLTLRKEGEEITLDFSGTSPERGSYNTFSHGVAAFMATFLYPYVFSDMPVSTGAFAPFSIEVPEGTLLNASPESAVCNCVYVGRTVVGLCHDAFTKMLYGTDPDRIAASPTTHSGSGSYRGTNDYGITESNTITFTQNTDGAGARPDKDGMSAHGFFYSPWGKAPNAEEREESQIFLNLVRNHHEDTAGFGEFRGGSGTQNFNVVVSDDPVEINSTGKGSRIPHDTGVFGGYASTGMPGISVTNTDILERLEEGKAIPTDVRDLLTDRTIEGKYRIDRVNRPTRTLETGDLFVNLSSGGGGLGDPLDRAPEKVADDLNEGLISTWTAREVFGVEVDDGAVDEEATEQTREETRADRIDRGMPYDDFVEDWEQKQPPEEALKFYGPWPEAIVESNETTRIGSGANLAETDD